MKIYDSFPFLDELEILEIRLRYLKNIVDTCVISQSFRTHRGEPWNPILNYNHPLIEEYSSFMEFHLIFTENEVETNWGREKNQRTSMDSILKNVQDDDLIIVSDVDEIPNRKSIMHARDSKNLKPHSLKMKNAFTYANTVSQGYWYHAKIVSGNEFRGAQNLRELVNIKTMPYFGLHLSVVGGIDRWKRKISITPHEEMGLNFISSTELLEECIRMNLYPSLKNIYLWSGGRLKYLNESKTDGLINVIRELQPKWIKSYQKIGFDKQIILITKIWHMYKQHKIWLEKMKNNSYIKMSFEIFIYGAFFPIRCYSLLRRRLYIRTKIKRVSKFLRYRFNP